MREIEEVFPTFLNLSYLLYCFKLSWFCFREILLKIVTAMATAGIDAEFLNLMDASPSIHRKSFL